MRLAVVDFTLVVVVPLRIDHEVIYSIIVFFRFVCVYVHSSSSYPPVYVHLHGMSNIYKHEMPPDGVHHVMLC
jgi:hypothetical protein